jgi:putative hydrolase of the HAD superfamily
VSQGPEVSATIAPAPGSPADFARNVRTWIFDLDNTLYPPTSHLFDQIDRRMTAFIGALLDLPPERAHAVQKDYFHRYGTSLRGLMAEHDADPEAYLAAVHDVDYSVLAPDPALGAALDALPGRRIVYTNGSTRHAEKVLAQLGIRDAFSAIFDIRDAGYWPKPHPSSYDALIAREGFDPARAVLVEDSLKNLPPAARLGMRTVWLHNHRDTAGVGLFDPADCTAVIDDLVAWLQAVGACADG